MFVKDTGGIGIINIADADPCHSEIHPLTKCTRSAVYFTPGSQQRRSGSGFGFEVKKSNNDVGPVIIAPNRS
jgi:hypothetical protein